MGKMGGLIRDEKKQFLLDVDTMNMDHNNRQIISDNTVHTEVEVKILQISLMLIELLNIGKTRTIITTNTKKIRGLKLDLGAAIKGNGELDKEIDQRKSGKFI